MSVDTFVEALENARDGHMKGSAYPKQGRHGDWSAGFNLLPVSRRETERDHVFLAETPSLSQLADSFPQPGKEFRLIWHLPLCRGPRAEIPRAD